jgi:hypothetical protein
MARGPHLRTNAKELGEGLCLRHSWFIRHLAYRAERLPACFHRLEECGCVLRIAVFLLILVLPVQVTLHLQPRSFIDIRGDGDLVLLGLPNLANGVRGGSGTERDPYVISGWLIPPASTSVWRNCDPFGPCISSAGLPNLRIENTRAHLVLSNNEIQGTEQVALPLGNALWRSPRGLVIKNVENLTIEHLVARDFMGAIRIEDSINITLKKVNLTEEHLGSWVGFDVVRSNVSIENSVFSGHFMGLSGVESSMVVRNSIFEGNLICGLCGGGPPLANVVDAKHNWWGSRDGPNSEGADVAYISPNVQVSPWLTSPPPGAGYDPVVLDASVGRLGLGVG